MSDLSAYGSSIQGLKEQAQSCRVKPDPSSHLNTAHVLSFIGGFLMCNKASDR